MAAAIDTRLYRTGANTITLDNNAGGAATLASVAGTLSNFATITRAGALAITTSSGNGSITYTTNGSGNHIFNSTTGNVQINRPITTSAGDLTLNPAGSNINFSSKNLTSVGSVVVSSSSSSFNALDLNAPATNTGTGSGPRISLGSTFSASGDEPATIKLLLYPNYGFAVGGAGLNAIVPSGSNHRFYCADAAGSTPVMVLNSASITANRTLIAGTTNTAGVVIASGSTGVTATLTPNAIDLRGSFYNSLGSDVAGLKLRIFNDGTRAMGIGVSVNQFNYVASNNTFNHVFYVGTSEIMRITPTGVQKLGTINNYVGLGTTNYTASSTAEQSVALSTVGSGSLTVPANLLGAGSMFKVTLRFQTNNTSNPGFTLRLKIGGITVYSNSVSPFFTGTGEIQFKVYIAAANAIDNTVIDGVRFYSTGGWSFDSVPFSNPTQINWSVEQAISLTAQFTAGGSASDWFRATVLSVQPNF